MFENVGQIGDVLDGRLPWQVVGLVFEIGELFGQLNVRGLAVECVYEQIVNDVCAVGRA